jgi:hypothetical protein
LKITKELGDVAHRDHRFSPWRVGVGHRISFAGITGA